MMLDTPVMKDRGNRMWILLSCLLIVAVAGVLRWGTSIERRGPIFDERWISRPIAELIRHGWSVERAIDFQETKGPTMIWPYALIGGLIVDDPHEVAGPDAPLGDRYGTRELTWTAPVEGGPAPAPPRMMNILRAISVVVFVLSVVPLLWLAVICGIRGPPLLLVTVGFALLPYETLLGQMVMGEVSFVFLALWLVVVVAFGLGADGPRRHPIGAPILAGLLLAIMLHSRPHAVAFMPGICLLAAWRLGWRSWPWWLACVLAIVLRLPLWQRWGGLVSSDFQTFHGLGFRLESLNYLAAALVMPLGAFLITWVVQRRWRRSRWAWLPLVGMAAGLTLGFGWPPDFALPLLDLSVLQERFMGFAATISKMIGGPEHAAQWVLPWVSMLGLASLGAFLALALEYNSNRVAAMVLRLEAMTMGAGWALYAFTYGPVFDRYLLAWTIALPVAWVVLLPRWLLGALYGVLAVALAYLVWVWLV